MLHRVALPCFVITLLSGCATPSSDVISQTETYAPTSHVEILLKSPTRPHKTFALLEDTSGGTPAEINARLASAARRIGADAVVITAVRDTLHRSPRASGVVLPLAVSTFRLNVPIAWVVGLLFLGQLYGVTFGVASLVSIVITATLLSFSVPGLPSASLFLLSPVLVQHGIPAEGVGILIALDAIPDMFKTLANVTAHLTSAVVLDRGTIA